MFQVISDTSKMLGKWRKLEIMHRVVPPNFVVIALYLLLACPYKFKEFHVEYDSEFLHRTSCYLYVSLSFTIDSF
jgi:hypothetical protein